MQQTSLDTKKSKVTTDSLPLTSQQLSSLAASLIPTLDTRKLKEFRRTAFSQLEKSKPASSKNEDFKYTNFQAHVKPFKRLEISKGIDSVKKISSAPSFCVIANGRFSQELSSFSKSIVSVYEASMELPEAFYEISSSLMKECHEAPLKLLSDVTFNQLIHIQVPENESVSIEISHVNHGGGALESEGQIGYSVPRILVTAQKNSKAQIIENMSSYDDHQYFSNHTIFFTLEEDSKVDHIMVQNENRKTVRASTVYSHQTGKSLFKTVSLNFGSRLTRNEVYPYIGAEGCDAWLVGANLLNGNQHLDNFTVIDHAVPNCESHELYKGLYNDNSVGVFAGTIIVRPDAQKTNAYQSNSSILLSDSAESYSRPQLKIWADDVKCSHGATVGQVDEEALFYLMARGIPEKDAKIMLTKAYVGEVFSHIEDETLHANVQELLEKKLAEIV